MIEKNNIDIPNNIKAKYWIAFFSQTGSEICDLTRRIEKKPDLVITNQSSFDAINPGLLNDQEITIITVPDRPTVSDYYQILGKYKKEEVIITLHGWLRIIPPEICERYTIFNGHPGLITRYPELRGKDPQLRAFLGDYDIIGCVIHRVVPEVDEGPVVYQSFVRTPSPNTVENVFYVLKQLSLGIWSTFFNNNVIWL